jgi:hypothetical protein
MSTPGHGPDDTPTPPGGSPPAGLPQQGYPTYGAQPVYGPPARRGQPLILGLVLGVLVGAGILGLFWALSGSSGAKADAEAVCGVVSRTELPGKDTPLEHLRRWGVAEVGPSMAEQNSAYKPLADALEKAVHAMRQFDTEEMTDSVQRVRDLCADI